MGDTESWQGQVLGKALFLYSSQVASELRLSSPHRIHLPCYAPGQPRAPRAHEMVEVSGGMDWLKAGRSRQQRRVRRVTCRQIPEAEDLIRSRFSYEAQEGQNRLATRGLSTGYSPQYRSWAATHRACWPLRARSNPPGACFDTHHIAQEKPLRPSFEVEYR